MSKTIGIIGSQGFIGGNLFQYFLDNTDYDVVPIYRGYETPSDIEFDCIINAGGNSRKMIAEADPCMDFEKNVKEVYWSVINHRYKKYVLIGSIDAIDSIGVYGHNKKIAEGIVQKLKHHCILRCGSVIGPKMKKGVVYDIVNDLPVWIDLTSTIQFVTVKKIFQYIENYVNSDYLDNMCLNMIGHGNAMPFEIATALGKDPSKLKFSDMAHTENYRYEPYHEIIESSVEFIKEYAEDERMEKPV